MGMDVEEQCMRVINKLRDEIEYVGKSLDSKDYEIALESIGMVSASLAAQRQKAQNMDSASTSMVDVVKYRTAQRTAKKFLSELESIQNQLNIYKARYDNENKKHPQHNSNDKYEAKYNMQYKEKRFTEWANGQLEDYLAISEKTLADLYSQKDIMLHVSRGSAKLKKVFKSSSQYLQKITKQYEKRKIIIVVGLLIGIIYLIFWIFGR